MASSLKSVTLRTKHFTASVDVKNRTWDLSGEFPRTVRTIADNPWDGDILRSEIQELYDLESTIRSMFDVKAPAKEVESDGIRMHDVPEG